MSEHSTAVDKVAPYSTEDEPANDGLHQRMSGYGYQSPPPSLSSPGLGVDSRNGHDSSELSGQGQGPAPSRTFGYQKPSHAWQAATQAWRTSGVEQTPADVDEVASEVDEVSSDVDQTSSDFDQAPSDLDQVSSDVEQASSDTEENPWNVDQASSDVEEMRSEIEHTKSRLEEAEADVEQTPLDAGDTSPEAAEARLRSVPATRGFWSRISGSGSPQASTYPAEPSTADFPSPEADPEPYAPDAESPQPVVDPRTPDFDVMSEAESEAQPEPDPAPEPEVADTFAVEQEPDTTRYPPTSPAVSAFAAPPPAPAPAPATAPAPVHDVRLIVQAVENAEGAAMAYAREIGEARRHLSEAIAHLDQADATRGQLNRLAAGFGSQG